MPGKIVSREEWLVSRKELLEKEKAATRASDAFNEQLRNFPMVKIEKEYAFSGTTGRVTLSDLFDGRKQLLVYHFMLGPDDEVGCNGCCFVADNLPGRLEHLHARNTTLVLVSRAPLSKIEKFKNRMGWNFPWYSSSESPFNYDFQATLDNEVLPPEYNFKPSSIETKGERPGLSVFYKEGENIFHTYSTYSRGLDHLLVTHKLLDLTPLGRQDKNGMNWKLHDEYDKESEEIASE